MAGADGPRDTNKLQLPPGHGEWQGVVAWARCVRLWGMEDGKERQSPLSDHAAAAQVHIQCGVSGVGGGDDAFAVPQQSWERSRDFSYTRQYVELTAPNATHLHLDFVAVNGTVVDALTLVQAQQHPAPFPSNVDGSGGPDLHRVTMQELDAARVPRHSHRKPAL